ncbi:MAG: dienelactone hydrolase family protein [Pseudomonadota bacterium]
MGFRILCVTFLVCWGLGSAAQAQDRGLGNATKAFTDPSQISNSDISDPNEMHRAWVAAIVRVPTGKSRSKKLTTSRLLGWSPQTDAKLPAVIYLHGCSGIWQGTHRRVQFMANLGFVVVAPASFARQKYPQSCDVQTNTGGMYRNTLKIRQNDAVYALRQARRLPFIDPSRIVIMGSSEGGITTATLRPQQGEAARIIEGWTCQAGWGEYKGMNASASTPVLALVGANDPWFQDRWTRGNCTRNLRANNGSRSVVYTSGRLAAVHELLDHAQPRQEVVNFLAARGLIQ